MPDLVIENARVLLDGFLQTVDIAIEEGRFTGFKRSGGFRDYDLKVNARGRLTLPGVIDVHVHFRDPGETYKEDWYTGSQSAAAGGVTTVIDHPNTNPPVVNRLSLRLKLEAAEKKSIVDYGINGGVNQGQSSLIKQSLEELWQEGVTAFGEVFPEDAPALPAALEKCNELGAILCLHPEDSGVNQEHTDLLRGNMEARVYSRARPPLSERVAVKKTLELLPPGGRLHLCHITTPLSLELIRNFIKTHLTDKGTTKQSEHPTPRTAERRARVTCEVTPHHLLLTDQDWLELGSLGKMNPPLREPAAREALWKALQKGEINMIASDHAPHTLPEKQDDIWTAPPGVPGVETLLPLMLMQVKHNRIPLSRLIQLTSQNPARIFKLKGKGELKEGFDADLVILGDRQRIKASHLHSRAGWTPFEGWEGISPLYTISRGEIILFEGEITAKKGRGRFLPGVGASGVPNS